VTFFLRLYVFRYLTQGYWTLIDKQCFYASHITSML